jgi:hypothetical protein
LVAAARGGSLIVKDVTEPAEVTVATVDPLGISIPLTVCPTAVSEFESQVTVLVENASGTVSPDRVVSVAVLLIVNDVTEPAEFTVATVVLLSIPSPVTYWPTAIEPFEVQATVALSSMVSQEASV